jgi:hypothetical protein
MYYFYSRIPEIKAEAYKITEYTGSEKDVLLAHDVNPTWVDRIDGDYFYRQAAGGEIKHLIKEFIFKKHS